MNEPLENITILPDDVNVQQWRVVFQGPVSCLSCFFELKCS